MKSATVGTPQAPPLHFSKDIPLKSVSATTMRKMSQKMEPINLATLA